jgi:hypothetical protein
VNIEASQFLLFLALNLVVLVNGVWLTCWLGGWKTWAERVLDCFLYSFGLVVVSFETLHFVKWITVDGLFVFCLSTMFALALAGRLGGWEIRTFFVWNPIRRLGWSGQALLCLLVAWLCAYIYYCRFLPPRASDPLAYHLPVPAQFVRDRSLMLFPSYPAAWSCMYLPINAEIIWAWLMLPFGNDVTVRFGQMPFLAAIVLAMFTMWRRWSLSLGLALGGAALVMIFRPFLRELVIPNVDIVLTSAFLLFACQFQRLNAHWKSWVRCGLALGLMIGTKIHGLIFLIPCLVLLVVKHFEWRKVWSGSEAARAWSGFATSILLVGGWAYIRNWVLTGNPFYPSRFSVGGVTIFAGVVNSDTMASAHRGLGNAWRFLFTYGTFGMPVCTAIIWSGAVLTGLTGCWLRRDQKAMRGELLGLCCLLLLGFVLLFWKTPFLDERYLFPCYGIGLMFIGWLLVWLDAAPWKWLAPITLLAVAVCFGRESINIRTVLLLTPIYGLVVFALLRGILWINDWAPRAQIRFIPAAIAVALVVGSCAVFGPYLKRYQAVKFYNYRQAWPQFASGWEWLNEQTRGRELVVAYTGSAFIYPLFGQDLQNSLRYVPVEIRAHDFLHELEFSASIPAGSLEAFNHFVVTLARKDPDRDHWLKRILEARASFLVIMRENEVGLIEQRWAEQLPGIFEKVFDQNAITIYWLRVRGVT